MTEQIAMMAFGWTVLALVFWAAIWALARRSPGK